MSEPSGSRGGALVVGGTIAGIQATLDLANSGVRVHLVEPSPFLGNGSAGESGLVQGALPAPLHARLLEVAKHPHVTLWTKTRINRADGEVGRFRIELRQHPRYVDLNKCTACGDCLTVCPVTVPGTSQKAIYLPEGGQPGCAVIEKMGKAPCANTCPGGIHVQGYIALIAQGRFREALDLIRQAIPFPGICGRICTHPCEINCRRAEVDEAVAIRLLKRFVADWELQHPEDTRDDDLPSPQEYSGPPPDAPRVAVVGAGPAGMAVANSLVRRGYHVTVFEALPVVGGMMMLGIPSYRLPREVIQREIGRIERQGVEIRLNTRIGPDGEHTIDDLFEMGYRAVFIGVGAHQAHSLRIPGETRDGQPLQGVVSGIELLKAINLSHQTDDPRWQMKVLSYLLGGVATRVAIIGGGNTAIDVARSLKRLGVEDVRILYRRTRAEMPALPEEIEEAEHEGVPIEFLVAPVRILGDERDRVVALECVRMKLGEADHSGRRRPVPIAGSEFTLELDMIVPAIGQSPDLDFLGGSHPFAITREGTFNIDRVSYMTNHPGVFAAGDAITQPVSVIDAIGSAKQAAAGIDAYLRGVEAADLPLSAREAPISRRELLPEEVVPKPRHKAPTIAMARRLNSHAEVELGFDAETAIAEAQRCLMCGPCSECLACEAVCEANAIVHDDVERFEQIEVGAIIWASPTPPLPPPGRGEGLDSPPSRGGMGGGEISPVVDPSALHLNLGPTAANGQVGIYHVRPDDPLAGSVAAARVMMDLFTEREPSEASAREILGSARRILGSARRILGFTRPASTTGVARIGVFVCQCNGQISDIVDTALVEADAAGRKGVVYTQVLAQSCSPEAADAIYQAVADHNLNRVVLAACSCCSVDQVCYSCTYQRVRCKDNLLGRHFDPGNPLFEFVNIREQVSWAYDDPQVATAAAMAMISAAIAETRLSVATPYASPPLDRTVLIVGSGAAAAVCQDALSAQRIEAVHLRSVPRQIRQTPNHFTVTDEGMRDGGRPQAGAALVLAPADEQERARIDEAFGKPGWWPRTQSNWGGVDTHRPGVFVCEPGGDPVGAGMAAAARVAAWLMQEHIWPEIPAAMVNAALCRGCGDCELVCEFGAIQLQPTGNVDAVGNDTFVAWIDPTICRGDGICAVRCPAGAITTGHATSQQIEAMLEAILA